MQFVYGCAVGQKLIFELSPLPTFTVITHASRISKLECLCGLGI